MKLIAWRERESGLGIFDEEEGWMNGWKEGADQGRQYKM